VEQTAYDTTQTAKEFFSID